MTRGRFSISILRGPGLALLLAAAGCAADDESGLMQGNGAGTYDPGAQAAAPPRSDVPEPPATEPDPDAAAPALVVNPFVRTTHDPFSTFAADVDSASYDIFVKSVTELGQLPPPDMVRSEEFVNFFEYGYPEVADDAPHPFEVHLDVGPTPSASTVTLRVGVQGKRLPADRPGANLVFLVDVSGSMGSADKLPLAQTMLRDALDVLRPDDRVSIVTYAGSTRVVLAPTQVADADAIRSAVEGLRSGGGTAGADGLELAYDQAEAGFIEGGINHIILCTDGDFNIGPHTNQELLDIVEGRRANGVTFTALGFGLDNLNDSMMEAISNAGNGIYRVLSGPETARRYVEQRILSDVVHIAKDVKIQVELNPERVYAYRQIGYENRQLADDDFRDDLVDAGEVGSGHQMTALYELALTEDAVPRVQGAPPTTDGEPVEGEREIAASELVLVKLRYKDPGALETDAATEIRASLPGTSTPGELDEDSNFAWAASTLAARLRGDPYQSVERLDAAGTILSRLPASAPTERTDLAGHYLRAMSMMP